MRRTLSAFLLIPALALLLALPSAEAQFVPDPLVGTYMNATNGGICTVAPAFGGYLFVNENGDQGAFVYVGPRRLAISNTLYWDRSVTATVIRSRHGRLAIRFDSPGAPPGLWIKAN